MANSLTDGVGCGDESSEPPSPLVRTVDDQGAMGARAAGGASCSTAERLRVGDVGDVCEVRGRALHRELTDCPFRLSATVEECVLRRPELGWPLPLELM